MKWVEKKMIFNFKYFLSGIMAGFLLMSWVALPFVV